MSAATPKTLATLFHRPAPPTLRDAISRSLDDVDTLVLLLARSGSGRVVIAEVNDAFCRTTGVGRAQAVGTEWDSLLVPGPATRPVTHALRTTEPIQAELWCRGPGSHFLFGFRLTPLTSKVGEGDPQLFTVLGRDITAQTAATHGTRTSQLLLARVFASIRTAIAITDMNGTLVMTNPHFDRMHGYPPGTLAGRHGRDLVAPASVGPITAARLHQIETNQEYELGIKALRHDGTILDAMLHATVVEGAPGERFRLVTLTPRAGGAFKVAGNIRLIGLDEVRDALGPRWPAVAEKAMAAADHIIRRGLRPGDTFSRTDEGGFLICFAGAAEEEARFRAAMIARDIRARLLGDGADDTTSQVTAIVARVDTDGVADRDLNRHLAERLGDRRTEAEKHARLTLHEAPTATRCVLEPIVTRGRIAYGSIADLPQAARKNLAAALHLLPDRDTTGFDLNILTLTVAIEHAPDIPGTQPILVGVDFDLLAQRDRADRFLELCRTVPPAFRQRLTFMAANIRLDTGVRRALLHVQSLRPFCRDIGFDLAEPEVPPAALTDACGARRFLASLPAQRLLTGDRARLSQFIALLHARDGLLLARGIPAAANNAPWTSLHQLGTDLFAAPSPPGRGPG